ncbi:MAG: cupredoxin domain-containing protein [Acidobacteria bacterium]|nr:cupredoxin domain-containing protein [Acidobacteriota bacterium]
MTLRNIFAFAVALSFAAVVGSAQAPSAPAKPSQAQKKVQKVKLSFDDKGYVVTPSTLAKGVPVEMDVDLDTVKGCMRTVVIASLNVKKTVKAGDTLIAFTPDKAGNVPVICGMNMGKGAFTVVDSK